MRRRFNAILGGLLVGSRWVMAPLSLGLVAALAVVLVQFFRELVHDLADFGAMGDGAVIIGVLKLVDLVLVANLVLMIIGAAVGVVLPAAPGAAEAGDAAGLASFGAIKVRLFASISAIAAIDVLETLINVDKTEALWEVVVLLAFAVSGVLLALMDRLGAERR